MIIQREEMYFEPRVINENGIIRWYGERYTADKLLYHTEKTVYIRDDGAELFVYELNSDQLREAEKIEAVFTLICRIRKNSGGYQYGRKIT